MEGDSAFEFSRADAAALRRGVDPWEVRGFYALLRRYDFSPRFVALAAPALAEVREAVETKLGSDCRRRGITERRFRRVLASRDREDLVRQLKGLVRLLGREANPDELIETVVFWGSVARRRLAQDYFGDDDAE